MIEFENITIEVSEEDISHGQRKSCERCPIALATKRAGYVLIEVTEETVTFGRNKYETYTRVLPESAIRFIQLFDRDEPVEPFQFLLEAPKNEVF